MGKRLPAAGRSAVAREVSQVELTEVIPLLATLSKLMSRASHEVPPSLKAVFMTHALAPRHMNVLLSLALGGPMSVSDLSTRLGVGLATTSLLVGELSRVALVERSEDPDDRRRTMVDLSPAHRKTVGNFLSHKAGLIRTAMEPLEPEERAALVKGLRSIVACLEMSAETNRGVARQERF